MNKQDKIEKVMEEFENGTLKTSSGKKVTSRKQALAIALSESEGYSEKADLIDQINISSVQQAEEILKSAGSEDLFEKAKHQDGDMHPNGKWVWVSSANGGKGDWRTKGGRTHTKHSDTGGDNTGNSAAKTAIQPTKSTVSDNTEVKKKTTPSTSNSKISQNKIEDDKVVVDFMNTTEFKENKILKKVVDLFKDNWDTKKWFFEDKNIERRNLILKNIKNDLPIAKIIISGKFPSYNVGTNTYYVGDNFTQMNFFTDEARDGYEYTIKRGNKIIGQWHSSKYGSTDSEAKKQARVYALLYTYNR